MECHHAHDVTQSLIIPITIVHLIEREVIHIVKDNSYLVIYLFVDGQDLRLMKLCIFLLYSEN